MAVKSKEERKRKQAAIQIQNAYRCFVARRTARDYFRAKFVKVYDEYESCYVYKKRSTAETLFNKPSFFWYNDDIPKKRNFEAPPEYNPGEENTSTGFLLLVTSNDFPLGKWPSIDATAAQADHDNLSTIFGHDFICKFRPENITLLNNCTTLEFLDALVDLRKKCSAKSFLVVYLLTHIITIVNGEKKNKKETSYLVFRNSVWDTPVETAESCVSLTVFSQVLNRVRSRHKTVLINYAHIPKPRPSLFPSAKIVYPSGDFITRLADSAKCVVIASCSSGTVVRELVRHSASTTTVMVLPPPSPLILLPSKRVVLEEARRRQAQDAKLLSASGSKRTEEALSLSDAVKVVVQTPTETSAKKAAILARLMQDWALSPPPDIIRSERPVKPGATWKKSDARGNPIEVTLPVTKERNTYLRRLALWKARTTLAAPVNFTRRMLRRYQKYSMTAPLQISIVEEGAVSDALRGGACSPDSPVVTVEALFRCVHAKVKADIARIKATALEELGPGGAADEELLARINAINQSPVLVLPLPASAKKFRVWHGSQQQPMTEAEYLRNPVCYRCGPPAPPDKPYIVRVGNNEVLLEWYNPPFAGVPPTRYKVYMRNKSRNYNTWQEVYYPGDITKTHFLVRDLPMGVSCQFRVAACNSGGWGQLSQETIFVTPGEENEQMSNGIKWRRIQQGGILAALDHMHTCLCDSNEQHRGLKMLLSFGQTNNGFKNSAMALQVAAVVMAVLKVFDKDPAIIGLSYTVLGWCVRGKAERKVRHFCIEEGIVALVAESTRKFRMNSNVMNATSWLRNAMPKYLPLPVEGGSYVPLNPQPKVKDGSLFEEEDEEFEYILDDGGEEEKTES